ncbi:Hypothetical predicted protein [Podarcis lilfordi]|uniref:Phospholipid scramblase n=1 Tax=Podarcis lilfordi TaxID=74358 RepID=A0AA35P8J5_9SAUR|nr:Hypothetical predicted protein [Podarcis lilfordi]
MAPKETDEHRPKKTLHKHFPTAVRKAGPRPVRMPGHGVQNSTDELLYPGELMSIKQGYPGVYGSSLSCCKLKMGDVCIPQAVTWMRATIPDLGCPPGLEYLNLLDQIVVHQQIELLEIIMGFENCNKYEIKNGWGQRIYLAVEETDCCVRNCCGAACPFTVKIMDRVGQEVIELQRPLRCSSCWYPCCLQELEVHAPPGTPVGYIKQTWHPFLPKFAIQNELHQDVLKITGPCVLCSLCQDVNFEVMLLDEETKVGRISKHWTGFLEEAFPNTDNFGITFSLDLDVRMKAVLLGACFLVDFMFFECAGRGQQRTGV